MQRVSDLPTRDSRLVTPTAQKVKLLEEPKIPKSVAWSFLGRSLGTSVLCYYSVVFVDSRALSRHSYRPVEHSHTMNAQPEAETTPDTASSPFNLTKLLAFITVYYRHHRARVIQTRDPFRIEDVLFTLQPHQVSHSADERLFILSIIVAAAHIAQYYIMDHIKATHHMVALLLESYRRWDYDGVTLITNEGLGWVQEFFCILYELLMYLRRNRNN